MSRLLDAALEATVVGSFSRVGYEVRSRLSDWQDQFDLSGKRILITGGTSGIGKAAARAALTAGAEVAVTGRSQARLTAAVDDTAVASARAVPLVSDAADLDGVQPLLDTVLDRLGGLDIIVHNAGALDREYARSPQGFERTYAVHVLFPFLLTSAAVPLLGRRGKIITVSSGGMYTQALQPHRLQMSPTDYDGVRAYAIAKRTQVALNEKWAQLHPEGPTFAAMHPGWADTPGVQESLPGFRRVTRPILRTPEQGADTILWLAQNDTPSGRFWLDRQPRGVTRLPWLRYTQADIDAVFDVVRSDTGVAQLPPSP